MRVNTGYYAILLCILKIQEHDIRCTINKRRKKIYVTNFRQSASKEDKQKITRTDRKTWKITREKRKTTRPNTTRNVRIGKKKQDHGEMEEKNKTENGGLN
jgi:hypothetical protein